MKSKISIVVPVYNVESFLPSCLDSLIGQSYKDIEIICVNDGSTDGSANVLKEYKKKDSRIIIVTKKNGGLSSARNAGLDKCKGDYVMFCDSDDAFAPTMCEDMLHAIEEDDSDIAACMAKVVYSSHEELKKSDDDYYTLRYAGRNYMRDSLLLDVDVSVCNKIFRRDIIEKNKIRFPDGLNNEDYYFFYSYACYSFIISFVYKRLYIYNRRDGSIMSNIFESDRCELDHLLVINKLINRYIDSGFMVKHRDLYWRQWLNGYHFSIHWSSPRFRKKVFACAKEFLDKNYEKWKPSKDEIVNEIDRLFYGRGRMKAKIRGGISRVLFKIRLQYRLQVMMRERIDTIAYRNDVLRKKAKVLEILYNDKQA